MSKLVDTIYWEDFQNYYKKAAVLQSINLASENGRDTSEPLHVDDPLQHHVTIYDTVDREYAGFSNAIQQIWYGSKNPKRWQADARFDDYKLAEYEWFYLMLVHRLTGSGASFAHDHGFRNSILKDLALNADNISDMRKYVVEQMQSGRAVFTSIGNQIPMFPKPQEPFSRGSELYLYDYASPLVIHFWHHLNNNKLKLSIRDGVDWLNDWHRRHGFKCFHFQMTAFVMDVATYFPLLIDPFSQVNYGKNAVEALSLLFGNDGFKNKQAFLDAAMDKICETFNGKAMSLEDVACDYVRYVECYVPKGYEHLELWQVTNNSLIPSHEKHWTYKARL